MQRTRKLTSDQFGFTFDGLISGNNANTNADAQNVAIQGPLLEAKQSDGQYCEETADGADVSTSSTCRSKDQKEKPPNGKTKDLANVTRCANIEKAPPSERDEIKPNLAISKKRKRQTRLTETIVPQEEHIAESSARIIVDKPKSSGPTQIDSKSRTNERQYSRKRIIEPEKTQSGPAPKTSVGSVKEAKTSHGHRTRKADPKPTRKVVCENKLPDSPTVEVAEETKNESENHAKPPRGRGRPPKFRDTVLATEAPASKPRKTGRQRTTKEKEEEKLQEPAHTLNQGLNSQSLLQETNIDSGLAPIAGPEATLPTSRVNRRGRPKKNEALAKLEPRTSRAAKGDRDARPLRSSTDLKKSTGEATEGEKLPNTKGLALFQEVYQKGSRNGRKSARVAIASKSVSQERARTTRTSSKKPRRDVEDVNASEGALPRTSCGERLGSEDVLGPERIPQDKRQRSMAADTRQQVRTKGEFEGRSISIPSQPKKNATRKAAKSRWEEETASVLQPHREAARVRSRNKGEAEENAQPKAKSSTKSDGRPAVKYPEPKVPNTLRLGTGIVGQGVAKLEFRL